MSKSFQDNEHRKFNDVFDNDNSDEMDCELEYVQRNEQENEKEYQEYVKDYEQYVEDYENYLQGCEEGFEEEGCEGGYDERYEEKEDKNEDEDEIEINNEDFNKNTNCIRIVNKNTKGIRTVNKNTNGTRIVNKNSLINYKNILDFNIEKRDNLKGNIEKFYESDHTIDIGEEDLIKQIEDLNNLPDLDYKINNSVRKSKDLNEYQVGNLLKDINQYRISKEVDSELEKRLIYRYGVLLKNVYIYKPSNLFKFINTNNTIVKRRNTGKISTRSTSKKSTSKKRNESESENKINKNFNIKIDDINSKLNDWEKHGNNFKKTLIKLGFIVPENLQKYNRIDYVIYKVFKFNISLPSDDISRFNECNINFKYKSIFIDFTYEDYHVIIFNKSTIDRTLFEGIIEDDIHLTDYVEKGIPSLTKILKYKKEPSLKTINRNNKIDKIDKSTDVCSTYQKPNSKKVKSVKPMHKLENFGICSKSRNNDIVKDKGINKCIDVSSKDSKLKHVDYSTLNSIHKKKLNNDENKDTIKKLSNPCNYEDNDINDNNGEYFIELPILFRNLKDDSLSFVKKCYIKFRTYGIDIYLYYKEFFIKFNLKDIKNLEYIKVV